MTNTIKSFSLLAVVSGVGISLCTTLPAQAVTTFLGSSTGDFGTVDTDTRTFTSIGSTVTFFDIATASPTLGYGMTGFEEFYSIDLETASTNFIGRNSFLDFINGLDFDNSGNLFGTGYSELYNINLETGAASLVAFIRGFDSSGDIAFDGNKFFATSTSPVSDTLFSFNSDGSNQTQIGSIGFEGVYGLTYQEDTLFGFTADKDILTIDTTTGAGTDIGDVLGIRGQVYGAAESIETVPEPASIVGTAVALGMAILMRKKNNALE